MLLHGPQGVGQFELAMTIAQAWLCETPEPAGGPCGQCPSCRLVQARSHPDLLVLVPEILQEALGWGADDADAERSAKSKPSKEIKVDALRAAVAFAQTSSARGRGKVVVLHPAERMNGIAANAFLKTLEEPPGATRFVLSCSAPDALLPTIRSRCQSVAMGLPDVEQATAWLAGQGVDDAGVLLAAAGGQPQEALAWFRQGIDAGLWQRLPQMVALGVAPPLASWSLSNVVNALQKVCHDAMCMTAGSAPRYFPPASATGSGADLRALVQWMRELHRVSRNVEHPWSAGLTIESLVQQGCRALRPRAVPGRAGAR